MACTYIYFRTFIEILQFLFLCPFIPHKNSKNIYTGVWITTQGVLDIIKLLIQHTSEKHYNNN